MGNALFQVPSSCTSKGALLLVAAANGDKAAAEELLARHPKAASYYNFKDRSSPLLQAAARGHFDLLQLILETAVMTEGPERAKKNCIDHANSKRQTALMVACKHGHPDCVEYLVTNGGDPLLTDERRHNTCLHFAALYGHSECVHKLLGSRAAYRVQGRQVPVAQIPCTDDGVTMKFIDRHNGWGLSALHIAVFQGSLSTVRALLRHGADIESVICAAKVENSPIRCAVGSNALHIAALTGNIIMAKLILETQENYPGLELRARTNAAGLKPHDYAQSARNPVLLHLLDERLPVSLLRQIWMNYSLEPSMPPRHQTLGSMLQKLKLMFNLELIAIQRNVSHLQAQHEAAVAAAVSQQQPQHGAHSPAATPDRALHARHAAHGVAAEAAGALDIPSRHLAHSLQAAHAYGACGAVAATAATATATISTLAAKHRCADPSNVLLPWARRQDEITQLLSTVTQLHDNLKQLCRRDDPSPGESGEVSRADRAATYEAVLDFILSTLITPRTVSAVLHAAKKVVSASVTGSAALSTGGPPMELPPADSDAQHGLALLSTALRAVETCLQGAVYLTSPAALRPDGAGAISRLTGQRAAGSAGGPDLATTSTATSPAANDGAGTTVASAIDPFLLAGGTGLIAIPVEPLGVGLGPSTGGGAGATSQRSDAGGAAVHGSATGNLVSDALAEVQVPGATAAATPPHASPRSSVTASALAVHSPSNLGATGLLMQPSALRGIGDGPMVPAFATHWSAQLHTLIAQLQWDIGVQRHRRRRAHAAAAAARNAAATAAAAAAAANAAVNTAAASMTSNATSAQTGGHAPVHPAPAASSVPASAPRAAVSPARATAAATDARPSAGTADAAGGEDGDGTTTASAANLLRVLSSRRGDAVQDILRSQAGGGASVLPAVQSRSDSGVSTPIAEGQPAGGPPQPSGTDGAGGPALAALAGVARPALHLSAPQLEDGASSAVQDVSPLQHRGAPAIQPEEIIPVVPVSTVLAQSRAHAAATASAATPPPAAAKRGGGGERRDHRGKERDRGKDRDATGAGGDAGGGLDGQDDTPAASESGSDWSDDDRNVCSICMDLPVAVLVAGCQHGLCVQCAFQLCVKGRELPSCPFCRQKIGGFEAKEMAGGAAHAAASHAGASAT